MEENNRFVGSELADLVESSSRKAGTSTLVRRYRNGVFHAIVSAPLALDVLEPNSHGEH